MKDTCAQNAIYMNENGSSNSSYKSSEGFYKKSLKTAIHGKDFTEKRQSKLGHKRRVRLIFQISHLVQTICSVNCSVV